MKKLSGSILITAALTLLTACSGKSQEDVFVLTANQSAIIADGNTAVTFTATLNGRDVSSDQALNMSCTAEGMDSQNLSGTSFSTRLPGTYTFYATYTKESGAVITSNSVTVSATASSESLSSYHHRVFVMQFTSVGCINCPVMSENLGLLEDEMGDDIVIASFHRDYGGYADAMAVPITSTYIDRFGISGLPQASIAMRPETVGSILNDLRTAVNTELENSSTTGLAIETNYNEATIEITLKCVSTIASICRYAIFLVEDGIEDFQLGAEVSPYIHNHVVRASRSANIYGERLNRGESLFPGVEYTTSWTLNITEDWNLENMSVIAAVLKTEDEGQTYISDNAAKCALGQNIDYKYE